MNTENVQYTIEIMDVLYLTSEETSIHLDVVVDNAQLGQITVGDVERIIEDAHNLGKVQRVPLEYLGTDNKRHRVTCQSAEANNHIVFYKIRKRKVKD